MTLGGKKYQGSSATHSSISIGSVYTPDGGKSLIAYNGADAVGIAFGSNFQATATSSVTGTEVKYAQRNLGDETWNQRVQCNLIWQCTTTVGHLYQWSYIGVNGKIETPSLTIKPNNANNCTYNCNNTSGSTPIYGTSANRTWSDTNLNGAAWQSTANATVDNLIGASNGKTGVTLPSTNMVPTPTLPGVALNNLGSAVIDGMLIQHMKITTKGL